MLASKEVKVKKVTVEQEEIQNVTLVLTEKEACRIRMALYMMHGHAYNRNKVRYDVADYETLDKQMEDLKISYYYFK